MRFEIDAPGASEEDLEGLMTRTERYCTVLQTLRRPPEVEAVRASAAVPRSEQADGRAIPIATDARWRS